MKGEKAIKLKKEAILAYIMALIQNLLGKSDNKTDQKNQQPNSHDEIQTGFLSYTCQGFIVTYNKHLLYVLVVLLKKLAYIKNNIPIRNNRICRVQRNTTQPEKGRLTENERAQTKNGVQWQEALKEIGVKQAGRETRAMCTRWTSFEIDDSIIQDTKCVTVLP
jgi:hypothetical protein